MKKLMTTSQNNILNDNIPNIALLTPQVACPGASTPEAAVAAAATS
jgi:hypothetical protein